MAWTSVIECQPSLFAYAAVPRHLSGCFIVVILPKFRFTSTQKFGRDICQALLSGIILLIGVTIRVVKNDLGKKGHPTLTYNPVHVSLLMLLKKFSFSAVKKMQIFIPTSLFSPGWRFGSVSSSQCFHFACDENCHAMSCHKFAPTYRTCFKFLVIVPRRSPRPFHLASFHSESYQ